MFRFCSLERPSWLFREDAFEGLRSGCRETSSGGSCRGPGQRWLKQGTVIKGLLMVSWVLAALTVCGGQVEKWLARVLEIVPGICKLCSPVQELTLSSSPSTK